MAQGMGDDVVAEPRRPANGPERLIDPFDRPAVPLDNGTNGNLNRRQVLRRSEMTRCANCPRQHARQRRAKAWRYSRSASGRATSRNCPTLVPSHTNNSFSHKTHLKGFGSLEGPLVSITS